MSRVYEPQKPNSFSIGLAHAVEQAISDICLAFHRNDEAFFHQEKVKPERKNWKGKSK